MGYEISLNKAWQDLANQKAPKNLTIRFLGDEYSIDIDSKRVLSLACNIAVKELTSILILHYAAQKLKGLPNRTGIWLTFREFSGIEGYYDAYHRRSIEPLVRKYGKNPEAIREALKRFPGEISEGGDISITVEAFQNVPVLIKLWKADEEFGSDANIYFDASIKNIFCIEDIVVLAQILGSQL
jgi:hypothetical protein